MVLKTALFLSGRTFVGEIELFRKDTSLDDHCRTLSRQLSDFRKFLGPIFDTAFFVSKQKFWRKNLSFKDETFYEYSQTLGKNVLVFGKKRSAWLSKLHFTCRGELLAENQMIHKDKSANYFFWTVSGNFLGLCRKSLRCIFQKSPFHVQRKDPKKTALLKTIFFGKVKILSQIFFIIAEKFQKCYPYCILHVQRSFFRFMKIYNSFRFLGNNISAVCLEHFRHGCQNAFPRVWENFLRKINQFEKKVFSYFFCSMSGSVSDFWCIFLRHGFEKYILHVMKKISRRSLRWNYIICWNFWVFFSFFSGFRWKKRNQCCQNCNLRVQMNIFGLETLF